MDAMTPCYSTHENEHVSNVYQVFANVFLSRRRSSCDDRNVIFKWYPICAQLLIAVISRYMALLMRKKTYTNMTTVIQRVIDAMTRCESIPTKVFPCRPLSSSDEINSIFKWRPIFTQLLLDKMLHSGIFIHMYTCSIITTAMCQIFHTKFSK